MTGRRSIRAGATVIPPGRSIHVPAETLTPEAMRPQLEDLEQLDLLQEIVAATGDPGASAGALALRIERMPVLARRLVYRFTRRFPGRNPPRLAEVLALLGNQEVEVALLEYLEDLSTIKAGEEP